MQISDRAKRLTCRRLNSNLRLSSLESFCFPSDHPPLRIRFKANVSTGGDEALKQRVGDLETNFDQLLGQRFVEMGIASEYQGDDF